MKKILLIGALLSAVCSISSANPKKNVEPTNTHYGHEWVDLGLPSGTKWATCNVGASTPGDYGDFFAWGETTAKEVFLESNSVTCNKSYKAIGGDVNLDAAKANWRGSWRMPNWAELNELRQKCTWEWTTQDGSNGFKVTGPNGQSIFLPAAGYRKGGFVKNGVATAVQIIEEGTAGYYWTSNPQDDRLTEAKCLCGKDDNSIIIKRQRRSCGCSIRPVLVD